MKELLGRAIAARVKDGEVLGLGSGSTSEVAIRAIGERVKKECLRLAGVVTSFRSAMLAEEAGIQVLAPNSSAPLSWAFDGADEVDSQFMLIKGRWGAMLNEKIVAKRAGGIVVIVTENKLVQRLGEKFAIPVEVIPEAVHDAEAGLKAIGAREVTLRNLEDLGLVITAHNNYVLDARFDHITPELESRIKSVIGVVESGLFVGLAKEVLIARDGAVYSRKLSAPEQRLNI